MTVGMLRTPLVLLVEVLWGFAGVALFVQVFGRGDGPAPSLAAIAIVVVGSYGVARWLQASSLEETELRVAGLVATIVGLGIAGMVGFATVQPWGSFGVTGDGIGESAHIVAGMLAMLVLWLRGVRRGQLSGASLDDVLASSSVGFLFVVVAALSDPAARGAVSWGGLAFAYTLLVLLTLAALQAPAPEAGSTRFVRRYGLGLAAAAAGAFAVAVLAALVATQIADLASVFADPARDVAGYVERYLLRPLFNAIAYPFAWLAALIGSLIPDSEQQFTPEPPPETERPEPEEAGRPLWQTILFAIIFTAGALAVAAVIIALIWYAFRRFVRRDDDEARDRREQVEPATSLSDDLAALFGALGRRLRRPRSAGSTVAIRRLYGEVLATAGEQGLERPPATTPALFAPALDAHFASGLPSEITSAFVESRYGERVVDDARVRALTERWRQQHA